MEADGHKDFWDRISPFTLLLTMVILVFIGIALIPWVDIASRPRPQQGKTLSISYSWNNASARVIEQEVTSRIEGLVSAVKGVQSVSSNSEFGRGNVRAELKKDAEVSAVKFEISSLIRQIAKKLPKGVSYPNLSGGEIVNDGRTSGRPTSIRLLTYQIHADLESGQIQEYIKKTFDEALSGFKEIKSVSVSGGSSQYIDISYDPILIGNYGITVDDISEAIKGFMGKKAIIGNILVFDDVYDGNVRKTIHLSTEGYAGELGEMPLKEVNGKTIYLNNLTHIEYKDKVPDRFFRINGQNTIYMNIDVDADANPIFLADRLMEKIDRTAENLKEGISLSLSYNGSEQEKSELEKLIKRTLAALVILLLFVWFIRRDLKYLAIISTTIFANIFISILAYCLFNIRLHTFSLAGIAVAFGMIIDASIVMVDHYSYYRNRKAFISILAALLTTMGALVLIFFMPEKVQNDLADFSWIIIINLTIALLVAFFFVPPMVTVSNYSIRHSILKTERARKTIQWNRFYRKYIAFTQKRKWIYITVIILAFGLPFHLLPPAKDGTQYPPQGGGKTEKQWYEKVYDATFGSPFFQNELKTPLGKYFGGSMRMFSNYRVKNRSHEIQEKKLHIRGKMPMGGTAAELNEKVVILEQFLRQFNEIRRFETNVGSGGADITVEFKDEFQHTSFPYVLESKVIGQVLQIGGADWATYGISGRGFSNSLNLQYRSNHLDIYGYNYSVLYKYAEKLSEMLGRNRRVTDIAIEIPGTQTTGEELFVKYDDEKIALMGINPKAVHAKVSEILAGRNIGRDKDARMAADMELRSVRENEFDLWHLQNSNLEVDGRTVRFSDIMQIGKRPAKKGIPKKDQEYIIDVGFNFLGSYDLQYKFIEETMKEFSTLLPIGYHTDRHAWNWQQEEGKQYALILVIVVIIFFMCAILFESLQLPFVIITLIPVSFIGTFLTFCFSGISFGNGGFASMVLLSGIVVNAGIYIISEYRYELRENRKKNRLDVFICAYNHKIIPVILTILSTVLGLLPFLMDGVEEKFWFEFALGTMGGLLFSLPALIFIMPIFMSLKTASTTDGTPGATKKRPI